MSQSFTTMPLPLKERMIIKVYITKVLDPDQCEQCHMVREYVGEKTPPMCDVCGRMLCRSCYGSDGTYTSTDLNAYNICDGCVDLEDVEIEAILRMRRELAQ